jgi:hypothetical protein
MESGWHACSRLLGLICSARFAPSMTSQLPPGHPPAAEGIALLDLSTPGWRLLAANSAFRDAACLGQWPSGAEDTDADFWSVFGHVTDGKDSHKVGDLQRVYARAALAHPCPQCRPPNERLPATRPWRLPTCPFRLPWTHLRLSVPSTWR